MKQLGLGLNLSTKKTRKRDFLEEMERAVPWAVLVQIAEPHYPKAKTGRPPIGIQTMLRIHCLQQWFGLSDPAMEEAQHVPLYRKFAKLDGATARWSDETTILRFRHLLERHDLAVDMLRVVKDAANALGEFIGLGAVAAVGFLVINRVGEPTGPAQALAMAGFQWLCLRSVRLSKSWLWLPANAVAWAIGMPIIFLGAQAHEVTSNGAAITACIAPAIFVAGALVGVVHGIALLALAEGRMSSENAA